MFFAKSISKFVFQKAPDFHRLIQPDITIVDHCTMVVLVESRIVQFDDSLPNQLLSSPSLQQSAHAFKSAGICSLSDCNAADNAANLIVLQREGGSAWPGQFAFVGSEDATTCHIIFIQVNLNFLDFVLFGVFEN
jgi:hypothetical protein